MGDVVICWQLPCLLHPIVEAPPSTAWERATPFLIGVIILLVSVVTTHAIREAYERRFRELVPADLLKSLEPFDDPENSVPNLAWAIDAAQIPALLGTPLAGLFVLNQTHFLLLYTTVLAAGLVIFFYFLEKVSSTKYEDRGFKPLGYHISPLIICGVGLNLGCAALAVWAVS